MGSARGCISGAVFIWSVLEEDDQIIGVGELYLWSWYYGIEYARAQRVPGIFTVADQLRRIRDAGRTGDRSGCEPHLAEAGCGTGRADLLLL